MVSSWLCQRREGAHGTHIRSITVRHDGLVSAACSRSRVHARRARYPTELRCAPPGIIGHAPIERWPDVILVIGRSVPSTINMPPTMPVQMRHVHIVDLALCRSQCMWCMVSVPQPPCAHVWHGLQYGITCMGRRMAPRGLADVDTISRYRNLGGGSMPMDQVKGCCGWWCQWVPIVASVHIPIVSLYTAACRGRAPEENIRVYHLGRPREM